MMRSTKQCANVDRLLASLLDGQLKAETRVKLDTHVRECRTCAGKAEAQIQLRETLRALPTPLAPSRLTTSLLVLASKEQQRRAIRVNWRTRLTNLAERIRLFADNLMRPLAVPAAGGLAGGIMSTFCLLGLFGPNLIQQARAAHIADIPTGLFTEARLAGTLMPLSTSEPGELTVEVTIDEQGRMLDYRLPEGPKIQDAARRALENDLLFTRFTPATAFGQPVLGKVTIRFHHAEIDIKG